MSLDRRTNIFLLGDIPARQRVRLMYFFYLLQSKSRSSIFLQLFISANFGTKNCKYSPRAHARTEAMLVIPAGSRGYKGLLGELPQSRLWAFTHSSKCLRIGRIVYFCAVDR